MKSSGFTLIEVQIALVILVLIMGVIMGGIRLSDKTMKAVTHLSEKSSDYRISNQLLTQQISNIMPLATLENGKNTLLFDGEESSIYYMGYLSEHVVKGGPWFIHIYQQNDKLLLDYRVFDNARTMAENKAAHFESQVILDRVDSLLINYHSLKSQRQIRWIDRQTLPSMLSIQIKYVDNLSTEINIPIYSNEVTQTALNTIVIK